MLDTLSFHVVVALFSSGVPCGLPDYFGLLVVSNIVTSYGLPLVVYVVYIWNKLLMNHLFYIVVNPVGYNGVISSFCLYCMLFINLHEN